MTNHPNRSLHYKGNTFRKTSTTTDTVRGIAHVYEIDGPQGKGACLRPFLTTVTGCREYVNRVIEREAERNA